MALKLIGQETNGAGRRQCASWIDRFVDYTDNLEAPLIYRRWTAIATIASALEQRVWMTTSDKIFANLYVALIGHPGVGKSRTIMKGRALLETLKEGGHKLGPTDMTKASIVDCMFASPRNIPIHPVPPDGSNEFHSLTLIVDEWSVLLHSFEGDVIGVLTTFYDAGVLYEQHRRGKEIRIRIPKPQLSILAGSTPSNLIRFMPDFAWDQGFTSRLILVHSNERNTRDDFDEREVGLPTDLVLDIKRIFNLWGEFTITDGYKQAVREWRFTANEQPKPTHPKLAHYNARRRAHVFKLSMVAAVDRGDRLVLDSDDFHRALGWLHEAEAGMPEVFNAGTISVDARIMDEIEEFVRRTGPVTERRVLRFATNLLPAYNIIRVLQIMQASQRIIQTKDDPITYEVGEDS